MREYIVVLAFETYGVERMGYASVQVGGVEVAKVSPQLGTPKHLRPYLLFEAYNKIGHLEAYGHGGKPRVQIAIDDQAW